MIEITESLVLDPRCALLGFATLKNNFEAEGDTIFHTFFA